MRSLAVYVPKAGTMAERQIRYGSGVVGEPEPGASHVKVYFEGNLYHALGLETYAARVRQAAGRLVERYPTVATRMIPADDLVEVGRWDVDAQLLTVTDADALAAWTPLP